MKPANQNEMDVLLRSLGRRDAGLVSAVADEHLDADELNAFAEGAVTQQARARYSAHLAECWNCRSMVVSLTQSAGLATPRVVSEERKTSSFWHGVTAFFSQPILRFVLPAVVLVSIIGIAVIALRQDQTGEFVAKHEPAQAPNLDQANQTVPSQSPATEPTVPSSTVPPTTLATPPGVRRGESAGTAGGVASEGPTVLRKEAAPQPVEASPTFAPDVTSPPPPAPAYAGRDQAPALARQEEPKRDLEAGKVAESRTDTSDSTDRYKSTRPAANARDDQPEKRSNVQGLLREGRAYGDKDKKGARESDETTAVSGKRFVRQNNSWVDESYRQSTATTNVKRGSEQYRALIADEPGLRTFAEQLSGQVIVVWKSRAYKFY